MDKDDFIQLLGRLDAEFKLRQDFFLSLIKEDDWSFTVKLHALVEAATTHLLTHSHGDARTHEVFEQLPVSDTRVGKLAFVNALGLLTKEQQKFVRALSELRNQLVHRINNVNFTFADHIASLDSNQLRAFRISFSSWASEGQPRKSWEDSAETGPKLLLWAGALHLILEIQRKVATTRAERERSERLLDLADQIIANDPQLDPDWDGSDE